MLKERLEEVFPCGMIGIEMGNASAIRWGFQLLYAGLATWCIYHIYGQYRSHSLEGSTSYLIWLLLVYALWMIYRQDDTTVYVAERGLIVRRTPLTPEEWLRQLIWPNRWLAFVAYQGIIGFSEDFKEIHIANGAQGRLVLPVSLQYLSMKDKQTILGILLQKRVKRAVVTGKKTPEEIESIFRERFHEGHIHVSPSGDLYEDRKEPSTSVERKQREDESRLSKDGISTSESQQVKSASTQKETTNQERIMKSDK